MSDLLGKLAGGDRRSIGASNAVVQEVIRDREHFAQIINGLSHSDLLIRMRCADAAEKISRRHPEWPQPHKRTLLALAGSSTEQELRWHLAQMLPRLELTAAERRRTAAILFAYLEDRSRIVQTFALQALADLAISDHALQRRLLPLVEDRQKTGSPAVRARARKLLSALTA